MGFFCSKKKHYVDTSVVRMIADEHIPSAHLTALVESIFKGTGVVDSIQNQALNGSFRDFERMHRWADAGNYFYGLPDQTILTNTAGAAEIKAAIEADIADTVTVNYSHFRPLNNIHAGWQHLTENLGYDPVTNKIATLTASKGFDVYLEKMVGVHESEPGQEIEQSSVSQWGEGPSSGELPDRADWGDPAALGELVTTHEWIIGDAEVESVQIHYTWLDGTVQQESVVLYLTSYDQDQEYFQAQYTTSSGAIGYWTYDPLLGSHTALNAVFGDTYSAPGSYFPFVIFRREGVNRGDPAYQATDEYLTSVKLLEYLNMSYQEMSDAMHDDSDIGDVDQAVMMMGVPITSTNEADIEYMFRYFSRLYDQSPANAKDPHASTDTSVNSKYGTNGGPVESYAVDIQDADFRMTLSFDGIKKTYKVGTACPTGSYVRPTPELILPTNFTFLDGVTPYGVATRQKNIFQHQITDLIYEEITIDNPNVRYHIYRSKGAEAGASDDRLMIPVDYDIAKDMNSLQREELYYRSLHFVFNSHIVQKIKWWQSGLFAVILTIVVVVIAFFTGGAAAEFWAALVAGATGTAVMVLIEFLIMQILVGVAFEFAFAVAVDIIGAEEAMWLAAVLLVVGGVKVLKAGKLVVSSTAGNLIQAANGLLDAVGSAYGEAIMDLQDDYAEFKLLSDTLQEELDRGSDLLGNPLYINPFAFTGQEPMVVAGETPDDYFSRMAHSGNVGAKSLNIIQNFVNISLTLPTIEETVGDMNSGRYV